MNGLPPANLTVFGERAICLNRTSYNYHDLVTYRAANCTDSLSCGVASNNEKRFCIPKDKSNDTCPVNAFYFESNDTNFSLPEENIYSEDIYNQ